MNMRIGIFGAGNGGVSLFAIAAGLGHCAKIFADAAHASKLAKIIRNGGFYFNVEGRELTFVRLTDADVVSSTDALVEYADVIFNATPINAHGDVFERVWFSAVMRRKPIRFVNTSGGFSAFVQALIQKEDPVVRVASTEIFPYACRLAGLQCNVYRKKASIEVGFDAANDATVVPLFDAIGVPIKPKNDLLSVALASVNYIMHPTIAIFNLEKIVRGAPFLFYKHGITDEIARVLGNAEEERDMLAASLGMGGFKSTVRRIGEYYDGSFNTWADVSARCQAYASITAPSSISTRYLWEDVPCGLVPLYTLGQIVGVKMPTVGLIIENANVLLGTNFWNSEYNLLNNEDLAELIMDR